MSTRRNFISSLAATLVVASLPKAASIAATESTGKRFVTLGRCRGDSFTLADLELIVGTTIFGDDVDRSRQLSDQRFFDALCRCEDGGLIERACREEHDFGMARAFGCVRNKHTS